MSPDFTQARDPKDALRMEWLGHAMFLLEDGAGHRVVTDPFGEGVGYDLPDVEADIVLVSHDHFDHANVEIVKGDPQVVRTPGPHEVGGLSFTGFETYHDASGGSERGDNIIYRWNMQGLTLVHLGDLGHPLEGKMVEDLARPDILFVPVGGTFTIDDSQAEKVVRDLEPRIAIPMHFSNDACGFPIKTEEPFVSRFDKVEREGKNPVYLSGDLMPQPTTILVMGYTS